MISRVNRRATLIGSVVLLLMLGQFAATHTSAQGEDTLLEDQFTDNSNGWKVSYKTDSKLTIEDNALTIAVTKENAARWVTPNQKFPHNLTVKVDTVTVGDVSGGDWSLGIIIRADTRDANAAFYQFEVDGSGAWAFVTRTAGGKEYKVQREGKLKNLDLTTD